MPHNEDTCNHNLHKLHSLSCSVHAKITNKYVSCSFHRFLFGKFFSRFQNYNFLKHYKGNSIEIKINLKLKMGSQLK